MQTNLRIGNKSDPGVMWKTINNLLDTLVHVPHLCTLDSRAFDSK
jgi:hypothetical protein